MPTVTSAYNPIWAFTLNGAPAVGCQLFTYIAGTTTKQATYTDSTGVTQNTNPIILNSRGETANTSGTSVGVWVLPGVAYKYVLALPTDTDPPTSPIDSIDNVFGPLTAGSLPAALIGLVTDADLATSSVIYAIDQTYMRTAAEIAASVTPTNYGYAPGIIDRYGNNTTPGTTDMTTAIQAAANVCGIGGYKMQALAGTYLYTADIVMPTGTRSLQVKTYYACDLEGAGREQTIFLAGAGVVKGFSWDGGGADGSAYVFAGTVRNCMFDGGGVAATCLTYHNTNMPKVDHCYIRRATGRGIYFNWSIMPRLSHTYVTTCGSASFGMVEIDNCTLFKWDQSYCSQSNAGCIGGVLIDRTPNVVFVGGNCESIVAGPGIKVGSKAEAAKSCIAGSITGMDFENVLDHYLEFGYGLSGSATVSSWDIRDNSGYPAGQAVMPYGVKIKVANGLTFGNNNWAQSGAPTASYWFEGVSPNNITLEPHAGLSGQSWPYVMSNGSQAPAAGARVRYNSQDSPPSPFVGVLQQTLNATTWTDTLNAQGGYYERITANANAATNVTALTGNGLTDGVRCYIVGDGNSTAKHNIGANGFINKSGADLLLAANLIYLYQFNSASGRWVQIGT